MAEHPNNPESSQSNQPWQLKVPEKYTHPNIRPEEIDEGMVQHFADTPLPPQKIAQLFESLLLQTWFDHPEMEEDWPGYEYQAIILEDFDDEGRRVSDKLIEEGKSVSPWDFVR